MRYTWFIHFILTPILLSALLWNCSGEERKSDAEFIARVADRVITSRDFIQRSEYTIRPAWCASGQYVHRKIVLNSLIAEKLLALDFDAADSLLDANPAARNYLKGRMEQEMRQMHFQKTALENIHIPDEEVERTMLLAERTYDVQIIPMNDDRLAQRIAVDLQAGLTDFNALLQEIEAMGQQIPEKQIAFDTPTEDGLFKALYSGPLEKGQVLGPLHLDTDYNILVRVNGWTRSPLISDSEIQQVRQDVSERLSEIEARDLYEEWLGELMSGKELRLNEPVFRTVVEAAGEHYFKPEEERRKAFRDRFLETGDEGEKVIDDQETRLDEIQNEILFTVDEEVWTVARFEDYMQVHPLVFRRKKMSKADFAGQFRLAVADMIRDYYITREAYDEGYDSNPDVQRRTAMWRDNLIALHRRNELLKTADTDSLSEETIVDTFIEPEIRQLRAKYSPEIRINTNAFEKIRLTSIDMFVTQDNVPFPVVVPQFPALTRHDDLDYGKRTE